MGTSPSRLRMFIGRRRTADRGVKPRSRSRSDPLHSRGSAYCRARLSRSGNSSGEVGFHPRLGCGD